MKAKFIGCTHGFHNEIKREPVDLIVHTGDASNNRSPALNENEFLDFWRWFVHYPSQYKIFVPGNHDSYLDSPLCKEFMRYIKALDRTFILIDEEVNIEDKIFYGSPITPRFGDWSFMRNRDKMDKHWKNTLPDKIDVLITHGPRKGVLDCTRGTDTKMELVGDRALGNHIDRIKPSIHAFSHIHDSGDHKNFGEFTRDNITYLNVSCVEDGKFKEGLIHQGIIKEI